MKWTHLRNTTRLAVLAGAALLMTPVLATVAIALTSAEQAERSDLVVVARVLQQRTFVEQGQPYTDTLLEVQRALKGEAPGGKVMVRQMGGTVDGRTLVIPGDARLTPGETVVVFLADREPETGVVFLTALGQSKYDVVGTTDDGDLLIGRDLSGLILLDADKKPAQVETAPTLKRLLEEAKLVVKEPAR